MALEIVRNVLKNAKVGTVALITPIDQHGNMFKDRGKSLTGFMGALPAVLVSQDKSILMTDSRYTEMAKKEVKEPWVTVEFKGNNSIIEVLNKHFSGATVGVDFAYTSLDLFNALTKASITVESLPLPFEDQRPFEQIIALPQQVTGQSFKEKIGRIFTWMAAQQRGVLLLNKAEEVAWTTNLRGGDVEFVPVPRSFLLAAVDEKNLRHVTLFLNLPSLPEDIKTLLTAQMEGFNFRILPLETLSEELKAASKALPQGLKISHSPSVTLDQQASLAANEAAEVVIEAAPVDAWKSTKLPQELEGIRYAHVIDGLAVARFHHWLSQQSSLEGVTEWDLVERLASFRKQGQFYKQPSFATIMGSGANAAIIHYKPTAEKTGPVNPGEVLLVDSGAQYLCGGTTDVTRCFWVPSPLQPVPSPAQSRVCSAVMKGYLALMAARFPSGTSGMQLDSLARAPVWTHLGADYAHSTGHGVGAMLNVHEGPIGVGISRSPVALEKGNVLSVEPGAYLQPEGAFKGIGCRWESLVEVIDIQEEGEQPWAYGETALAGRRLLGLRALTCTPLDMRLIDVRMLSRAEAATLDDYHQWVRVQLTEAALDGQALTQEAEEAWQWEDREAFVSWLQAATAPVSPLLNEAMARPAPRGMF